MIRDPVLDPMLSFRSDHPLTTTEDAVHAVVQEGKRRCEGKSEMLTFCRTRPTGTRSARGSIGEGD
jgi:hypothetical protein